MKGVSPRADAQKNFHPHTPNIHVNVQCVERKPKAIMITETIIHMIDDLANEVQYQSDIHGNIPPSIRGMARKLKREIHQEQEREKVNAQKSEVKIEDSKTFNCCIDKEHEDEAMKAFAEWAKFEKDSFSPIYAMPEAKVSEVKIRDIEAEKGLEYLRGFAKGLRVASSTLAYQMDELTKKPDEEIKES